MSNNEGLGFAKRKLVAEIVKQNWDLQKPEDKKSFTYNEMLFVVQEMNEQEGKPYLEGHNSIKYGYEIFRRFAQLLLYRNLANYDSMVLLTSEKGTGKSSAAIMLAREWCKNIGIKFDPARHIAYNNADVMNKIDKLNKFEPIICDESIRFVSSEDWAKCLSGDTLIKTLEGNIKIKELINKKNIKLYTYNEYTKQEEIKVAEKCIKTKTDIVYEIELENGQTIKATKEHKFLTNNGWKELQQLTTEDELIVTE